MVLATIEGALPAGHSDVIVCTDEYAGIRFALAFLFLLIAYNDLKYNYFHYSVNHSDNEYSKMDKLPATFGGGAFINTSNHVEEIWSEMRSSCRSHFHRQCAKLDLFLDEIMFRHAGRDLLHLLKVVVAPREHHSTPTNFHNYEQDPSVAMI
jgi:hypothetical protein